MHKATRLHRSLLALVLTAAVAGCDDNPSGLIQNKEIAIGGLFSLTGNWATLGVTSKAAMEIGIEDVNQYLAAGNSGFHFTASIQDTKLTPATALTAITAMKANGIEVVLGPQSSAEVAALKSYVNDNNMLLISQSSTAGTLAIANDNVFRLTPSDTLEAVALVGVMKADAMTTIIPFWRNDAGNVGLQVATRALFGATAVKPGVQYEATTTDFAASIAALKTQVQAAIAERGGTTGVAVAHAGFDEVVDIFKLAAVDPVLSSVRWYGTDGTALNEPLRTSAVAAAFAKKVNFWTPTPGVDDGARARWEPVATRIAAKAGGAQPDAFALAVYDGVWLAAQAYLAAGGTGHVTALKSALVTAADGFYGASGWTKLNAAGDRKFGDFDFFALAQSGSTFSWTLAAQYNTQTGNLTRK
jgi:branched-chain amino acid transport system substrate-binding protein